MNIVDKYIITQDNLQETLYKLNKFCNNGFKKTHDWLRFTDKPDKTFDQLEFENRYPVYEFTNEGWNISKRFSKSVLLLQQEKYDNYLALIEIGAEIEFLEDVVYIYDTAETTWQFEWSCMVSKIYK